MPAIRLSSCVRFRVVATSRRPRARTFVVRPQARGAVRFVWRHGPRKTASHRGPVAIILLDTISPKRSIWLRSRTYRSRSLAAEANLEIISIGDTGGGLVASQWVLHGTHTGPYFDGSPPTGRTLTLPGAS